MYFQLSLSKTQELFEKQIQEHLDHQKMLNPWRVLVKVQQPILRACQICGSCGKKAKQLSKGTFFSFLRHDLFIPRNLRVCGGCNVKDLNEKFGLTKSATPADVLGIANSLKKYIFQQEKPFSEEPVKEQNDRVLR